ncbi:SIS domain-containing protein [Candidatus Bathyarchaeota archaeon]|nr:SIS domain-containing protein [Candidatus Bathyarchaeota archaeon]
MIDFSKIKTYPIAQRKNLVKLKDLISPKASPPPFDNPDLREVAERIVEARKKGRPVLWMMGAHVIKSGLSLIVIDLMRRGVITHVASNGAVTIHDFEIALIGETSEDVATSIEDGTFGMAEETGLLMNLAVQRGVHDGLGYGESLGRMIAEDERFKFKEYSVLYHAYKLGIPFTVHVALGTDIIHQHPRCNFAVLGEATGRDFKTYVETVSNLEGGVFLNFGSAVIGPEVFLKALSIARNLGFKVEKFTTANFDLKPIVDYTRPRSKDDPDYYYRPLKNIVIRPTSMGGKGFHITGDHIVTIPNLHHMILQRLEETGTPLEPPRRTAEPQSLQMQIERIFQTYPVVKGIIDDFVERNQELNCVAEDLIKAFMMINHCFETGGTLFICGNGGSFADAFHISAELTKAFKRKRPVPPYKRRWFKGLPQGDLIAENLEEGLRVMVLGANHSLYSAVENDNPIRNMSFAQELYALARQGDILLGISTSGNAENVFYAAVTAKALGLTVIALTGREGGKIAEIADISVKAPATETSHVQEIHTIIYHTLCEMLEASLCERNR